MKKLIIFGVVAFVGCTPYEPYFYDHPAFYEHIDTLYAYPSRGGTE